MWPSQQLGLDKAQVDHTKTTHSQLTLTYFSVNTYILKYDPYPILVV